MFPDYSTFKTYRHIYNCYATLCNTTKLFIEGIGTTAYTLIGKTILPYDALHIPALHVPLYSLRKHRKQPGCGFYSSYNDGSYLFFTYFILQLEYSHDDIVSYRPMVQSHQGPIDYIDPKSTWSINRSTPYGCPSMVTNPYKLPPPHIITPYEDAISSESPLPITTDVQPLPPPPTEAISPSREIGKVIS